MKLTLTDLADGAPIPVRFAFGRHDPQTHVRFSDNLNPGVRWRDLPAGTRSLVLICVDETAPSVADDVNREGRSVPADLPRAPFYHWAIVDLDPASGGIDEGACARGVTPHGKRAPSGPAGARQGLNDYTSWFAADPDMAGDYYGYDGPCPPWNDSIPHRYHFTLYATDLARCAVDGPFTGPAVLKAIEGHVLALDRITGTYAVNPQAR